MLCRAALPISTEQQEERNQSLPEARVTKKTSSKSEEGARPGENRDNEALQPQLALWPLSVWKA